MIFVDWIQLHPYGGFFSIAAGICILIVCTIPLGIWAIGAGFAYHKVYSEAWKAVMMGSGAVFLGMYVGGIIAVFIGKFMLRDCADSWAQKYRIFRAIDQSIAEKNGLKLAFIIRLCPISPFAAVSYLLGMSKLSIQEVMLANFGSLPMLVFYNYIGSQLSGM